VTASVDGMSTTAAGTAFGSMASHRFLISPWPWRSLGYLLSSLPVMLIAGIPLGILGLPWLFLFAGRHQPHSHAVLIALLGTALIRVFGPLVAIPLSIVERRRLRLVDDRTAASGHQRPFDVGPLAWLRTRYSDEATWRELVYAIGFVTVGPIVLFCLWLLATQILVLVIAPLLYQSEHGFVALGLVHVDNMGEAFVGTLIGVSLLPALAYLLTLVAAGHAALGRVLLAGPADHPVG
jgi:Putative sensor